MAHEFNLAQPMAADDVQQQRQQPVTDVPVLKTTDLDRIVDSGNPNVAALVSPETSNTTTITTTTTTNRSVNMDREDIETVKYLPLHIDLTSSFKQPQASHQHHHPPHHHQHHHHSDDYIQDRGADDYGSHYDYDVSSTHSKKGASSLILSANGVTCHSICIRLRKKSDEK